MSFFKKLGRKVGGKRSKHGAEVGSTSPGTPEEATTVAIRRPQFDGAVEAEDGGRELTLQPDRGPEEGSIPNYTPSQTINISGGTFTDVYIGTQINIHNIAEDTNDSKLFVALSPVAAAHDCQEDLEKWRTNESSVPIFILDGIAGIGKTTVVKTVCSRADAENRLAASWFFSRDQQDRKSTRSFVGTLAFQFASYHPALRERIVQALKDHPDILQKTIRAQFNTLIHEPLQAVLRELEGTHTISIDAIDECNLDEAAEILSILLGAAPKHPQLRLLITCRPERPFRLLLQRHRGPHIFHLHEIENSIVESDIRLYINYRLSPEQVDEALPDLLPPLWRASVKEKEALVQMAGKLFIVASTAVNFILDPRRLSPAKQIRQLLDATAGSGLASSPMDRLYTQVLCTAVPDPVNDWFNEYQVVVGAIVVAADVLPVRSLALLLDKGPNDIIRTLSHLHSLIAPTHRDEAFRVHHKSFPDFVTDPLRCSIDSRFLIDASAAHILLARGCLQVMVRMLKQNICDLPHSDWGKQLSQLPQGTIDRISPELAYACIHWVSHFLQGSSLFNGNEDSLFVGQLNALVDEHLLPWLEVLALEGRFNTAWNSVNALSEALSVALQAATGPASKTLSHVINVLQDCLRFINLNPDIPRFCPMHIYLSSLAFAPKGSVMSKQNTKSLPKESVKVLPGVNDNWDPLAVVIKNNASDLRFSPCGTMIAILTGHLALYDVKSGAKIREFFPNPPWCYPCCIVFSLDGNLVAVGIATNVYVWKVSSAELIAEFLVPKFIAHEAFENGGGDNDNDNDDDDDDKPRVLRLTSLAFASNCTSIAAGREDGTLFLWTLEGDRVPQHVVHPRKLSEACSCPLEEYQTCKAHYVGDLFALPTPKAFKFISVAGNDIQFWESPSPPNPLIIIPRHMGGTRPCPISFSSDSSMLAVQSNPCAISIYLTSQPCCIAILSGHQGLVKTTAFSTDCEELCSASEDMTIRFWNITTSTQLRLITTAPSILSDALFAKSVGTLIFRSEDRMMLLTGTDCAAFGPVVERNNSRNSVRLSLDASTIAISTSSFTTLSSLKDLTGAPSFDLDDFPYMTGFFPTGELVTGWNKEPASMEIVISELKDGTQLASTSFKITGTDPYASFVGSPDKTRVAVIAVSRSVSVYNLHSQSLEAFLEPLPEDEEWYSDPWVSFSGDSQTVYVERQDSELSHGFYTAILQPLPGRSQTCNKEPLSVVPFTKYDQSPDPSWRYLRVRDRSPSRSQTEEFTGSLQQPQSWTHVKPSSLPTHIDAIAYSPDGLLVALRSLPDHALVGTLEGNRHVYDMQFQFLPSLPHILVVHSKYRGITTWNTSTLEVVEDCAFSDLPNVLYLLHVHPYNTSDFLCLAYTFTASALCLVAVQLRGALPPKVCYICWFPPYLLIDSEYLEVNPCHPYIIALKGRNRPLLVDISQFPLPFTL
ncbi:hypothetical protein BKA70DRAFT_1449183 [Coprinopsis sp. MPI-PUGE-AT-0042]|nr:hypothetical protein BKA70DRAFT_1449183 [Coprinopsis sp. MPI-PUGE-AT-0042]